LAAQNQPEADKFAFPLLTMDIKIIGLILLDIVLIFCVYKTKKRKKVSNLFLAFSALLLGLLLAELAYRNLFKKKVAIMTANSFFRLDSSLGYCLDTGYIKADRYFPGDTIFSTHYTILSDTDSYGKSYPFRKAYKSDTAGKETVFLGCSFTFGEGLGDEQTLSYQYGKLTNTSAINRGCNGFGVHQVYQFFKSKYANRDNHDRVFVYSFFFEHILRASGVYVWNCGGPFFIIQGDTLYNKGVSYKVKPIKGARLAHYGSFMGTFTFIRDYVQRIALKKSIQELTDNDFAPSYLMLKQLAEMINKTGGKLVILNWDNSLSNSPSKILNQNIRDNRIEKELSNTGAVILPVSGALDLKNDKYLIPRDGHPSALANEVLAKYLAENLK
jgi:hypothetical protein